MARRVLAAVAVGTALILPIDASPRQDSARPPAAETPVPGTGQAPTEPPVKAGVAGIYMCEGMNPDGSLYKGVVEISAIESTYLVRWTMADGAEVLGVGIVNSGLLSVSYFGGTPAVAVYKIDGDRLVGEWTMGGAEGMLYSETLTRMREDQRPPRPERPSRPSRPTRRPPAPGTIQL